MAYQATWNDPFVTWDSLLYSWDGNHVEAEIVEARLRQSSVFAHITEQAPFARITQQRLYARVADGTSIGTPAGAIHKDFTDPSATFPLLDPATGNPVGATLSHGEVYAILWSLYMALAAERDAGL